MATNAILPSHPLMGVFTVHGCFPNDSYHFLCDEGILGTITVNISYYKGWTGWLQLTQTGPNTYKVVRALPDFLITDGNQPR